MRFTALLIATAALVAATPPPSAGVRVLDGDTIVVNGEHIRILGVDSPELPGHCRKGRDCAPGDPWKAKASMVALTTNATLVIHRITKDRYGRTVADVIANGISLSCSQLRGGFAIYKPEYDRGGMLARECSAGK